MQQIRLTPVMICVTGTIPWHISVVAVGLTPRDDFLVGHRTNCDAQSRFHQTTLFIGSIITCISNSDSKRLAESRAIISQEIE